MNEILQWAIMVVLAFLVLGILRQFSLMLPAAARAIPSGPPLGKPLPQSLRAEVARLLRGGSADDRAVVAFVTESCTGCQHLLAGVTGTNGAQSTE